MGHMPLLETTSLDTGAKTVAPLEGDRVLEGQNCTCTVRRLGARWEAVKVFGSAAVTLNGRRLERSGLSHGDTLFLWDRMVRFLDAPELPDDRFEALIEAAPEGDGRLEVWMDALLEHGDPLGTTLRTEGPDALFEGLLSHVLAGHLEVAVRHAVPREVRLRMLPPEFWPEAVVAQLVSLRALRWLEHLEIDASGARPPARVELHLLRLLTRLRLPRTLKRLTLSSVVVRPDRNVQDEVAALRERLPAGLDYRLPKVAAGASLVVTKTRGTPVVGPRCPLRGEVRFGLTEDRALTTAPTRLPDFVIEETPLGWILLMHGTTPVRLNGRLLNHLGDFHPSDRSRRDDDTRLVAGDVIELGPYTLRFELDVA